MNKTGIKFTKKLKTYDFGFLVQDNKFDFEDNLGISPSPNVISYALLVSLSGRASNIFLTGIDGYNIGDSRNQELELLFELYHKRKEIPKLISLTDTIFKVEINSIYNLI